MNSIIKSYAAVAAIGAGRIVKFSGAGIAIATAGGDAVVGVSDLAGATGDMVDVHVSGLAPVVLGGTVLRGEQLAANALGAAVSARSVAGPGVRVVGIALAAGVAGDIIDILVIPSVQARSLIKRFTAGSAIAVNTIVKCGAADGAVVPAAAVTDLAIGVAIAAADSGASVDVVLGGIASVVLGGDVTRGQKLASNGSAAAVAAAPATGVNNHVVGVALASGAAAAVIDIVVAPGVMQG